MTTIRGQLAKWSLLSKKCCPTSHNELCENGSMAVEKKIVGRFRGFVQSGFVCVDFLPDKKGFHETVK